MGAAEAATRPGLTGSAPGIRSLIPLLPAADAHFIAAYSATQPFDQPLIDAVRAAYDIAVQTEPLSDPHDPGHKVYRAVVLCETMLGAPRAASQEFFTWLIRQYAVGPDTPEAYTTRRVLQKTGLFLDTAGLQPWPPLPILSDRIVQDELARQARILADYEMAKTLCGRLNFPFDTFKHVINSESEFDAGAVNKDTDATGLAQFMRNTWLACILQLDKMPYGPQALAEIKRLDLLDMDEAKGSIVPTGGYNFTIADPVLKDRICTARLNAALNTLIAIPMLAESEEYARHRLPCSINPGINWLLNILGQSTGVKMVRAAFAHPKGHVNATLNQAIIRENSAVFGVPRHEFTARLMMAKLAEISNRVVVPEMLSGTVPPLSPPLLTPVLHQHSQRTRSAHALMR